MPRFDAFSLRNYALGGPTSGIKSAKSVAYVASSESVLVIAGLDFRPDKVIATISIPNQGSVVALISDSNDMYTSSSPTTLTDGASYVRNGAGLSSGVHARVITADGFTINGLPIGVIKTVNFFAYGKFE